MYIFADMIRLEQLQMTKKAPIAVPQRRKVAYIYCLLLYNSTFLSVDETNCAEESVFECCCGGCCTDSFPGYMIDEEHKMCCKGSIWSSLAFSGSVQFVQ